MWWQGASDFTDTFSLLEKKYKNIVIQAHCYGGYVTEGNVIFNAINQSSANVTYEIVGVSASMSAIVQMASNKITISENGLVMIHRPTAGQGGNADDMFSMGKLLKSMEANFIKVITRRSKKPESDVKKWLDGADHWFDAEEALALGLVDEIIPAVVKDINSLSKPETAADAESIYSKFTANLTASIPQSNSQNNKINMKEIFILALGLKGVTAESSDTAIKEAIASMLKEKDDKIIALTTTNASAVATQIEVMIKATEEKMGKPFAEGERANLTKLGTDAGIEILTTALSFMKPAAAESGAEQPAANGAPAAVNLIDGKGVTEFLQTGNHGHGHSGVSRMRMDCSSFHLKHRIQFSN